MQQSFAEAYGWPPEISERLPDEYAMWDPLIREAKHRVREMKQAEHARKQKFGR